MFKNLVYILLAYTLVALACNSNKTYTVSEVSEAYSEEIDAVNDAQLLIKEVAGLTKVTFGYVLNELGVHNYKEEENLIRIRQNDCIWPNKTTNEIKNELNTVEESEFRVTFMEDCFAGGLRVPYEGDLIITLYGRLCEPRGQMKVEVVDGFKVIEDDQREVLFHEGTVTYDYIETDENGNIIFDTVVDNILAREVTPDRNELLFNLVSLENAKSYINLGDIENDPNDPTTFLDDTAELVFTGGVMERSVENSGERANVNFNPSNLIFNVFCGCPIGGSLSANISITEFIIDYSPKSENCFASPRNTVISNGNVVIENEENIDTFLPCDGF